VNEELREHYRVVLTAIAPEPQVNKGDPRGMQSKVAADMMSCNLDHVWDLQEHV